jgi:hypothetical protein
VAEHFHDVLCGEQGIGVAQKTSVFLGLAHDRRRIPHFAVRAHPTAELTAQQLRETFPQDTPPHLYCAIEIAIFGHEFVQ